ncbi:MAG: DUF2029 domain-containing protein [Candidatus Eremiobacteraeota bacterium]|nr:DUF2029 domain-containing protein [Candidatus Eremiobacteraeota bacterium]
MKNDKIKKYIFIVLILFLIIFLFFYRGKCYLDLWGGLGEKPHFGHDFLKNHYFYGTLLKNGYTDIYADNIPPQIIEKTGFKSFFPPYYPPLVYAAHIPFSYMSRGAAVNLYFMLNHIWLFLTVFIVITIIQSRNGPTDPDRKYGTYHLIKKIGLALALTIVFLLFSPVIDNLFAGQINIFLTFVISLFVYLYLKERYILCALVLAVAINIKIFPVFFLFLFILYKQWKNVGFTLLFTLGLNLPFVFIMSPVKFYGGLFKWISTPDWGRMDHTRQTIHFTIVRILNIQAPDSSAFKWVVSLITIGIILLIIYTIHKNLTCRDKIEKFFLICLIPFIYLLGSVYVTATHHILLLILLAGTLVYFIPRWREYPDIALLTLLLSFLIACFDGEVTNRLNDAIFRFFILSESFGFYLALLAFFLNIYILKKKAPKLPESFHHEATEFTKKNTDDGKWRAEL